MITLYVAVDESCTKEPETCCQQVMGFLCTFHQHVCRARVWSVLSDNWMKGFLYIVLRYGVSWFATFDYFPRNDSKMIVMHDSILL